MCRYILFAASTLARSDPDNDDSPYGSISERRGFGPFAITISRALDAVPQGTAAVTTCTTPDAIRSVQIPTDSGSARFSFIVGTFGWNLFLE